MLQNLCLKGYSGFKNPFSRLSFFGFKTIFDHMRVHIPNIGYLSGSFLNSDKIIKGHKLYDSIVRNLICFAKQEVQY